MKCHRGNIMAKISEVAQELKKKLEDTMQGGYTGGCQEWINLIATADPSENEKEVNMLNALKALTTQFNATMSGNAPGDLTIWYQELNFAMNEHLT